MAKEINEKTFELNITSELLDISNSYIHYMTNKHISKIKSEDEWFDFFQNKKIFAEGLTQAQETNPKTGGYDVSINYKTDKDNVGRLLFLQYKSGEHCDYCMNPKSQFYGSRKNKKEHIAFTFNDAANGTQHSTLRRLAKKKEIISESVLYVFPRITKMSEFNVGSLLNNTSFVPVLEIDKQGKKQKPPIKIIDRVTHRYRTSYDGCKSEVNYFYYFFFYNNLILSELLSELICIQFERFFKNYIKNTTFAAEVEQLLEAIKDSIDSHSSFYKDVFFDKNIILDYLNLFEIKSLNISELKIPHAPQKYSSIIPIEGLKLSFENETDLSNITYQII
ncbi:MULTISPECIES: hypothetical protein [Flavobacterium]|uniref:DUF4365 domain-containing protein n=1 Tax=Flavobacterium hankyongi TaxID=1176532 RepID=A0ABP8ZTL3_9FLAO|nr:hypothetical protein [Flavobacterium sp. N1846]